ALAAGFDAEALGEIGLADARLAAEKERGALLQVATGGERPEPGLGDLGVVAEVEVSEITDLLEAGGAHAPVDAFGGAAGQFVVEQELEELERIKPLGAGGFEARGDGVEHARELEAAQARAQRVEGDHLRASVGGG